MFLRSISEKTPLERFRRAEKILATMGSNLEMYKGLDADRLSEAMETYARLANKMLRKTDAGSAIRDVGYGKARLMEEALRYLREYKLQRDESEVLVEGMTYYRNVSTEEIDGATYVRGERCTYTAPERATWAKFCDTERKLKIMEVLRYGSDMDFATLYLEMADGRPLEAQNGLIVEHITESTDQALYTMAAYADTRWNGQWPWESRSPKKLNDLIKGDREMRNARIIEMRDRFFELYNELMEGEIEQAKVIEAGAEFAEEVQGMIDDLGKASGEIMVNLRDQARTEFGEDAAHQLEQACSQQIGIAVDALSALRTAVQNQMKTLTGMIGQSGQAPGVGQVPPPNPHAATADAMAGVAGGEEGAGLEGEREKR